MFEMKHFSNWLNSWFFHKSSKEFEPEILTLSKSKAVKHNFEIFNTDLTLRCWRLPEVARLSLRLTNGTRTIFGEIIRSSQAREKSVFLASVCPYSLSRNTFPGWVFLWWQFDNWRHRGMKGYEKTKHSGYFKVHNYPLQKFQISNISGKPVMG